MHSFLAVEVSSMNCVIWLLPSCKKKYSHICRVAYLCKHETACLVGAGTSLKQKIKDLTGRDDYVGEYEEIKKSDRVNSAGRVSYVERNQWMVDESDITFIHIDKGYCIKNKNSGTALIYRYAKSRKRIIVGD